MSYGRTGQIIVGQKKNLGGFEVVRLLPQMSKRSVGPFVFLDQMGPSRFDPGTGMDVRPHPHIGLSTLTYLFEGAITHRDSLNNLNNILPGAVNWMTSGRGIVHSERTPGELRSKGFDIHGLQFWVALPKDKEECEPSFTHVPKQQIPKVAENNCAIAVVVGTWGNKTSPVPAESPTLFLDIQAHADCSFPNDRNLALSERQGWEFAWLMIEGTCELRSSSVSSHGEAAQGNGQAGDPLQEVVLAGSHELVVFEGRDFPHFRLQQGSRAILIGGEALPEPRHMWWNFVSTRKERIEQAKTQWTNKELGTVPGETEFIPLPG